MHEIDRVFRSLVGEIIQSLDYQDFEHQHRIKSRSAAFKAIRTSKGLVQIRAEDFKSHNSGGGFELTFNVK